MQKTQAYCRFALLYFFLILAGNVFSIENDPTPFSYEDHWGKVDLYTKLDRPESALKEVDVVLQQAQKDKNTVQLIKASLQAMVLRLQIDPDKAPTEISAFESLIGQTSNAADKALLQSMTADVYYQYYKSKLYIINRRTELEGQASADVREWTKNQYSDKIVKLLNESLSNEDVLQKTSIQPYRILLTNKANSLPPSNLYELLARRKIELLNELRNWLRLDNPMASTMPILVPTDAFERLSLDSTLLTGIDFALLRTFQQWLHYAANARDGETLVETDLYRLKSCLGILEMSRYIVRFGEQAKLLNYLQEQYLQSVHSLVEKHISKEQVLDALETEASFYLNHYVANDSVQKTFMKKAYDLAELGINRFPTSNKVVPLRNIQEQIKQVKISVAHKEAVKPNNTLMLNVQTWNIDTLVLHVYRVDGTTLEYLRHGRSESTPFPKAHLLEERMVLVQRDPNFDAANMTLPIKSKGYGIYEYSLEKAGCPELAFRGSFVVSDLACMLQNGPNSIVQLVDRVSGKPVPKVDMDLYSQEWINGRSELQPYILDAKADKTGQYQIAQKLYSKNLYFLFKHGPDQFFYSQNFLNNSRYNTSENKQAQVRLFTDRSVYRPGQTVHFKGIAYFSNSNVEEVIAGRTFDVNVMDANNKSFFKTTVRTNDFGSFAESFVLPGNVLSGSFYIRCNDYPTFFRVEEYKRPTFEVSMQLPKKEVRFGEEVTLQGRVAAYAGYPMSDATVSYRIVQRAHYRWNSYFPETEIMNGATKANADGNFSVSFRPERNPLLKEDQFFTYEVIATATDSKGETQVGKKTVSVGDKSLILLVNLSQKAKLEKDSVQSFDIRVETLNGTNRDTTLHYDLYRLKPTQTLNAFRDQGFVPERMELLRSGNHSTKDGNLKLDLKTFESGIYQLVLTTEDSQHQRVELSRDFVLFSQNDKQPPVPMYLWVYTSKTVCKPDESAHLTFGTSAQDVHVLYQVLLGDKEYEHKWLNFSNEIKTFDLPFESWYGAGVTVQFSFIKDEQFFTTSIPIKRWVDPRKLSPKWSVFRDKLQPGEKAEWSLNVPELLDKKAQAELMVYMYDASLDAVQAHSMWFSPEYRPTMLANPSWTSTVSNQRQRSLPFKIQKYPVNLPTLQKVDWMKLAFSKIQSQMFQEVKVYGSLSIADRMQGRVAGLDITNLDEHKVVVEERPVVRLGNNATISVATVKGAETAEPAVNVRQNFNETAFFYPQLQTDNKGNLTVSFTVPESLTRWNVNVLAHTKDLFSGMCTDQVVTQKDLMVQLNLPRFVRSSDSLLLRASVANLTDSSQQVQVKLELIDPRSGQLIRLRDGVTKSVKLAPKESKSLEWSLTEFAPFELVTCKVVAWNASFSDGEQRYLPVLPDRLLVTETLPMTVRAGTSRTFEMEHLLKSEASVKTQSLTVEFSPNPAWYAVQALPTLSAPQHENAIDYFTAYYVNTLASHILQTNPTISTVFDQWKSKGGSRDELLSKLEKNQELKNILLEETPWLVAAQNETEQMKRIALLFELNQQKKQNEQYWNKLLKLQLPSGGFSWFEGLQASRTVTQYLLLNNARLNTLLNAKAKPVETAVLKAIEYLDKLITDDFDRLSKFDNQYKNAMNIGNMQWFYLHVRSEYPQVPIPEYAREAVAYYTKQAQEYWQSASLYGRAATALIAARGQNPELAAQILLSLKENALKTEDMGMYWARNIGGYDWSQRPVMVQTMLMEAFAEITKDTAVVDEMKIWLLRQKQTQQWDSPLSTVDAVNALLTTGTDWLTSKNDVSIQLGAQKVATTSSVAGTGYVKKTYSAAETKPSMGHVQVALKGKSGIGWGALYWQFTQPAKEIKQSGNALTVSKKLFVEKMLPTGRTLQPIEKSVLKKGDKVVTRLVVTTDRDLEYVALKDLRAACFEPTKQRSGCAWMEGVVYYQTSKDASTQFFFASLPKGTYVFEYEVWVNNAGDFTSGITTLQCLYAPEFSAHSGGERISVSGN